MLAEEIEKLLKFLRENPREYMKKYSWEIQYGMSAKKGREILISNFSLKENAESLHLFF
jgi:hypothetical protein